MQHNLFAKISSTLKTLKNNKSHTPVLRELVDDYYALYRELKSDQSRIKKSELEHFLNSTAEEMKDLAPTIDYHVSNRLESALKSSFQFDEWIQICHLRSALECFRELYRSYFDIESLMPLDDELDQLLRQKGESEAYLDPKETPIGYPNSHWWWEMEGS